MQVLNTYIHDVLVKAMARDVAEEEEDGDGECEKQQDLGKVGPTPDSETEGPSRKRYRRAASLEATEVIRRKLNAKSSTEKTGNSQEDEDENDQDDDDDDEYQANAKSEEEEGEDSEEEEDDSDATISEEEV
jgi:phosphopantothenoylcysteine synthetase/decarboxylase